MGANRPPAVKTKAYIEIDIDALRKNGEIVHIGDPIIAPEITTRIPRGKFEVTYTAELFNILEKMGNKKIQVLAYLLDNKDSNNQLNMTYPELMAETGASRQTIADTLKILKEAGFLTRKNSVIMLSPRLMVKGNQMREAYLMRKYEEIETIPAIAATDIEIDEQYSFTTDGDIVQKAR